MPISAAVEYTRAPSLNEMLSFGTPISHNDKVYGVGEL